MRKLQNKRLRRLLAAGGCILAASLTLAGTAQEAMGSDVTYLSQGWDRDATRRWWYHVSQGTVFMPAEWFLALQQASGTAPFAAPDHLARLGFLPDAKSEQNPFGLPVGFAVRPLDFPDNGQLQHFQIWKENWIGFTCAACHTGQLTFNGQRIRVDGGPAHLDIERFTDELGAALVATAGSGPKFTAFAAAVRGLQTHVSDGELHQKLTVFLNDQGAQKSLFEMGAKMASEDPTPSGWGRLDAVQQGGNFLLAAELGKVENHFPPTAPVRYPALWDTPYFDWVLYNASIRQPMARNVIEDLGVGAPIDPATLGKGPINHAVLIDNIVEVHRVLKRLQSPQWPETILGGIDPALAGRGRQIFVQSCASCHQGIDRQTHDAGSAGDGSTVMVKTVPLEEIGTDPRQAKKFAERMINLQPIVDQPQIKYFKAAELVAGQIVKEWAEASPENARIEQEVDGGRKNEFRGEPGYRARPLNGLWAMPPYLHNGSVPTMYDLLLPTSHRPRTFYMGAWEYDPSKIGLSVGSPFTDASLFDTRLPGNSNAGHEYGSNLSDDDRAALLEYLKTL